MNSSVRHVKTIALIFVIIHVIFLFNLPLLPFIDLPNHLAEATIYKYYEASGNVLSHYYQPTPWYFPNTFHTVFCSLFPSVEVGNKIFHALCILLLAGSMFLVIDELKGNPWYGLLGLLFTYNYNLTYGFVGFAISIPVLIILFYVILLDLRQERIIFKISISFLLVLLFLMHAQNALFGLMLYGVMILYAYRHSFKKIFAHGLLVPLPLVALIFTWWYTRGTQEEESTLSYLVEYYSSEYFSQFLIRFRIVVFDNFQLREGLAGIIIATSIFICIFLPLFWLRAWKNITRTFLTSSNTIYALIFLITGLLCYLLLPDKLPGQTPLFQRFCSIVILSFIIFGSLLINKTNSQPLRYFSCVLILCYSLMWFEYLYSFNRQNKGFTKEFFTGVSNQSTLAGLIYQNSYRGRKVYIHYPNYFLVWNQGIAASKIIDYRFGVVRRVAPESELPFYNELIGEGYRELSQYNDLDYLLVRGSAPVNRDTNLEKFHRIRDAGAWSLYSNGKNEGGSTQNN